MCAAEPWYNTRNAALSQQGEYLPAQGTLFNLASAVPLLPKTELSSGMFHPNQRGQLEGYMPAYRDVLDRALTDRFTPKAITLAARGFLPGQPGPDLSRGHLGRRERA